MIGSVFESLFLFSLLFLSIPYYASLGIPRFVMKDECNHRAIAIISNVRKLDFFDSSAGCVYRIIYHTMKTPWWSFDTEPSSLREESSELRMECPTNTHVLDPVGSYLEGCYSESSPDKFFHRSNMDKVDITDMRMIRALDYALMFPPVLTLFMAIGIFVSRVFDKATKEKK